MGVCAEFCRFSTAPGRCFSACRAGTQFPWQQRLACVNLRAVNSSSLGSDSCFQKGTSEQPGSSAKKLEARVNCARSALLAAASALSLAFSRTGLTSTGPTGLGRCDLDGVCLVVD